MPYPTFLPEPLVKFDYAQPTDLSGIYYDLVKASAAPNGLAEADGFRVKVGEDGPETERYYDVPWSQVYYALAWFKGWSTNLITNILGHNPASPPPGLVSRQIPAQDPVFPHLYCADVELAEPAGCVIHDSTNWASAGVFVTDPLGNPAGVTYQMGPDGLPIVVPAVYYAENKGAAGVPGYFTNGNARLKARFTTRPYNIYNDVDVLAASLKFGCKPEQARMTEYQEEPSVQNLPLAKITAGQNGRGQLQFTGGPNIFGQASPVAPHTPVPESGVILLPTSQIRCKLLEFPDPDFDTLDAAMGQINIDPFWVGPNRQPKQPGTVLFVSYKKRRWRNCVGRVVYDLDLFFAYRLTGWNYFPCAFSSPSLLTFPATLGGGVNDPPVYDGADLNALWLSGPVLVTYQ